MLLKHKPKCENNDTTTIKTSPESHICWKKNIFARIHYILGYTQILKLIMKFCFKKTKKDLIMREEEDKDFKNNSICRFCETNIESDKVTDHCHLKGNYRGPAHNTCNINLKQKDSNFLP